MVTILFAYRNREKQRIKASLDSLKAQVNRNFKVIFIDYGTEEPLSSEIAELVNSYDFASCEYIPSAGMLWNKCKALNYGIKKTTTEYIFIADVDLLFHREVTDKLNKLASQETVFLFKMGYLSENDSKQILNKGSINLDTIKPSHWGNINGMLLVHKEALLKVNGYDEFFHLYGSEDVDVYERLNLAGFELKNDNETRFYHIWHPIYNAIDDYKMQVSPNMFNLKRINREHHLNNLKTKTIPNQGTNLGTVVTRKGQRQLENPTHIVELTNKHAEVQYFMNKKLPALKGTTVLLRVVEDSYCSTLKYKLKKFLNQQFPPFMTMKEVNDLIIEKIIYKYRDSNYTYRISNDCKSIEFIIAL